MKKGRRWYRRAVKVDVVVETPRFCRNKYEWDPDVNRMRLDRRIPGALSFPLDYGFIPDTLAVDGDPLDALVVLEEAAFPGVVVRTRPVAVCWICDGGDREPKIICVPTSDPSYSMVRDFSDLPCHVVNEVEQFFNAYKDLQPGRSSRFECFDDAKAARTVVRSCRI